MDNTSSLRLRAFLREFICGPPADVLHPRYDIDEEHDAELRARDRWDDPLAKAPSNTAQGLGRKQKGKEDVDREKKHRKIAQSPWSFTYKSEALIQNQIWIEGRVQCCHLSFLKNSQLACAARPPHAACSLMSAAVGAFATCTE